MFSSYTGVRKEPHPEGNFGTESVRRGWSWPRRYPEEERFKVGEHQVPSTCGRNEVGVLGAQQGSKYGQSRATKEETRERRSERRTAGNEVTRP